MRQLEFLIEQLGLLTSLCIGRENENVVRVSKDLVPFSVAFQGATSSDLPPKLRRGMSGRRSRNCAKRAGMRAVSRGRDEGGEQGPD